MNKLLLIVPVLLLGACEHTPDTGLAVGPKIPELKAPLNEKAASLEPITDFTTNGLVQAAARDRSQYNTVAGRYNTLIDIYNCVKESINNGEKEIECQ